MTQTTPWLASCALSAALVLGCGARDTCTSSLACGGSLVCGHDGACVALAEVPETLLARSERLAPRDWAVTRTDALADVVPARDSLEVGGEHDSQVHLAFGPLPSGRIARAVLSLEPHETAPRVTRPLTLVVARTSPFLGAGLTRHRAPSELDPKVERTVVAGPLPPLHVDVTELALAARRQGGDRIDLVLRIIGSQGALVYADVRAADSDARPRLDVLTARAGAP